MSKEFSRKDLKHQDEFLSGATRLMQWLLQRRKSIGLVLLIIIAGLSILLGVRSYQQRQEENAAAMLAIALRVYYSPVVSDAASDGAAAEADDHGAAGHTHYSSDQAKYEDAVRDLEPIIEQYGRQPSGRAAAFYLGNCFAALDRVDEAIVALEHAADSSSTLLAAMASYRLGHLYVEQERYEDALAVFEPLVDRPTAGFPVEQALVAKAQAHQAAGDRQAAMLAYQRIAEDYPTSVYATLARTQAEELAAILGVSLDVES